MKSAKKIWRIFSGGAAEADEAGGENLAEDGSGVRVRRFRYKDREAVLRIAEECFSGVCLDENIEGAFGKIGVPWQEHKRDSIDFDLTNNASSALVAVMDGKVVGFICNRLYRSRSTGHVANVAVMQAYQGRGVGKALLRASLDYFRAQGMRHARIETLEQNEKACKFYPSLGFEEVGRQIHYYKKL